MLDISYEDKLGSLTTLKYIKQNWTGDEGHSLGTSNFV